MLGLLLATTPAASTPTSRRSSFSSCAAGSGDRTSPFECLPSELIQEILSLVLSPQDDSPTRVRTALAVARGFPLLANQLQPIVGRHIRWVQSDLQQARREMEVVLDSGSQWVQAPADDLQRSAWEAEECRRMRLQSRIDGLVVELSRMQSLL